MSASVAISPLVWGGFLLFILLMLALDLGVFHRRAHVIRMGEAAIWSAVWISLALLFNLGVYLWLGPQKALEFGTAYLVEKALSVDNIFVFVIIFSTFAVPAVAQHRVLFWGVLGALVMRGAFIFAGGAFLEAFHWAIYILGGVLVLTGIKLMRSRHEEPHPERNPVVRLAGRLLPVATDAGPQPHFVVRRAGRWLATPLLLALIAVEVTDLIFAVDSIPAVFAISRDPFIVFTSNIFAILGLRSLYFLLAGLVRKLVYLKTGLSLILIFVGVKMTLVDLYKIPVGVSLAVIAVILAAAILLSLRKTRRDARLPAQRGEAPEATG